MATKRKSHFFEIYITKILKNICIKAELACGTRIQLNILLQILWEKTNVWIFNINNKPNK